jgi:hypothetical protein
MSDELMDSDLGPEALGLKLLEVCRMCEAGRAAMSPAERDAQLQLFLAQAMGPRGGLEATRQLCDAGMALRRMQEASKREEDK